MKAQQVHFCRTALQFFFKSITITIPCAWGTLLHILCRDLYIQKASKIHLVSSRARVRLSKLSHPHRPHLNFVNSRRHLLWKISHNHTTIVTSAPSPRLPVHEVSHLPAQNSLSSVPVYESLPLPPSQPRSSSAPPLGSPSPSSFPRSPATSLQNGHPCPCSSNH